jgi:hypothetical protein
VLKNLSAFLFKNKNHNNAGINDIEILYLRSVPPRKRDAEKNMPERVGPLRILMPGLLVQCGETPRAGIFFFPRTDKK